MAGCNKQLSSSATVTLAAPPDKKGNHNRARQSKPRDGILQMVVLEMHLQRPRFWNSARW